jgi:hypothetical protein
MAAPTFPDSRSTTLNRWKTNQHGTKTPPRKIILCLFVIAIGWYHVLLLQFKLYTWGKLLYYSVYCAGLCYEMRTFTKIGDCTLIVIRGYVSYCRSRSREN